MSTFGLDIGTRSIKAVQLENKGQNFALVAAGITATPPRGLSSDADADISLVAEAIKKLVSDTKISTRRANISLPESQVFTRRVELPGLTDQEVASAISWQAEPYIPIPVSEASIDYQIIGRREPQGKKLGSVEVLLVAAPKALIQKYIKVAGLAGLTVVNVETELLALSRALVPAQQTVMLADLGATSSDLGIVRGGQLVASRSVSTGGDVLTRAVSTGLSIATPQAEEYKKTYGLDPSQLEGKVKSSLDPVFRLIADEMKKLVQFYKAELAGSEPVGATILSGGTAGMPEITPFLAQSLGMEVVIGDPFSKVSKDERLTRSFAAYAPLYGVAVGLAQNI